MTARVVERLSGFFSRIAVVSAVATTCLLAGWGFATATSTVVKGEYSLIADGWSALGKGDVRLAASSFAAAMDERVLTSGPILGLACASWVAGYQDHALSSHQIYLGLKTRPLSDQNPCLGDLSLWGIEGVEIDGTTRIFPAAHGPGEESFEVVARDPDAPLVHRYAAMACLSHSKDLRLLSAIHLGSMEVELRIALSSDEPSNPVSDELQECINTQLSEYGTRDGTIIPKDMDERVFIGDGSPLPPKGPLPLQIPAPIGPDGRPIDLGDATRD